MRDSEFTLSAAPVCRLATNMILAGFQALGCFATGGTVSLLLLVRLLVRASAERRSLDAIARQAKGVPCPETIRQGVLRVLPAHTAGLEPMIQEALHQKVPKSLKRRPRDMIIDLHDKPYYGDKNTKGTFRGKPKASTKTFFSYATLLVVRKGLTLTIGLVPVLNSDDLSDIVLRLLRQAAAKGLKPRRLLLDRGFYSAKVMLALQNFPVPFLMPMIRRGKSGATKKQCTGTAQFFVKRRQGWVVYKWEARQRRGGRKGKRTLVKTEVAMVPRPESRVPLVYACWGMKHTDLDAVAALYRRRFRIETSYRQMHECLALTCSRNPVYRLLLVLIALVLRNLWLWLHWRVLAEPSPGKKRTLRLMLLRLRTLLHWLVRYLDQKLEIQIEIFVPKPTMASG
jgi:hypothetical protein